MKKLFICLTLLLFPFFLYASENSYSITKPPLTTTNDSELIFGERIKGITIFLGDKDIKLNVYREIPETNTEQWNYKVPLKLGENIFEFYVWKGGKSEITTITITRKLPACTDQDWQKNILPNAVCQSNGTIEVRWGSSLYCKGGIQHKPIEYEKCTYKEITCTSFEYSRWSECSNNRQVRLITSSTPKNCIKGNPITEQPCEEIPIITEKPIDKIQETIDNEKKLLDTIDLNLTKKLTGKILLQVENNGEAWYVKNNGRYYMANGDEAYKIMRNLGVGITNKDLEKVINNKEFAKKHSGKIFLQVENHGEAYYIDFNGMSHYLKNGDEAYKIMKTLGLGIKNSDLRRININL